MALDNGGAYAIRGFNFQKASIISVIIDNYNKDGFTLLVETEDDFVIMYDEYKAFIQCKNQKLSIANLIKDQKKNKKVLPSILYKNLSIGTPEDVHKVFSRDFIEKEKKMLELRVPGEICGNVYHFNKELDLRQVFGHLLPKFFLWATSRMDCSTSQVARQSGKSL